MLKFTSTSQQLSGHCEVLFHLQIDRLFQITAFNKKKKKILFIAINPITLYDWCYAGSVEDNEILQYYGPIKTCAVLLGVALTWSVSTALYCKLLTVRQAASQTAGTKNIL